MAILRYPVGCKNCHKTVAFTIGIQSVPDIYCYACEPVVTHQEEMRQESIAIYQKALLSLQGQTSSK